MNFSLVRVSSDIYGTLNGSRAAAQNSIYVRWPTHDLHIMTQTMTQTKCGDLNFVEVLKVMKTPKGFECRNRQGRTANYRRRRDQQWYMVHEVNSWDESRLKDSPMIHTNNTNKPNQTKKTWNHSISFDWHPMIWTDDWLRLTAQLEWKLALWNVPFLTWFRIKFTPISYNYV